MIRSALRILWSVQLKEVICCCWIIRKALESGSFGLITQSDPEGHLHASCCSNRSCIAGRTPPEKRSQLHESGQTMATLRLLTFRVTPISPLRAGLSASGALRATEGRQEAGYCTGSKLVLDCGGRLFSLNLLDRLSPWWALWGGRGQQGWVFSLVFQILGTAAAPTP